MESDQTTLLMITVCRHKMLDLPCSELRHSQQQFVAESTEPRWLFPSPQSERLKQLLRYNDFPKSQYCINLGCSNWGLQTLKGNYSPLLNPGRQGYLGVKTLKDHLRQNIFNKKKKLKNQTKQQNKTTTTQNQQNKNQDTIQHFSNKEKLIRGSTVTPGQEWDHLSNCCPAFANPQYRHDVPFGQDSKITWIVVVSFPETLEEWVVVDYQSGKEFTGFQYLRYFNLCTDSGS